MPIPVSARAMLSVGDPPQLYVGTLGEQILRFVALDATQRRQSSMTVLSVVELPGWRAPRTYLDAEAIREVAREMTARGLI